MDKQQKRMVFQYHDNTEINYAFGFFFRQTVVARLQEILKDKIEQAT